jgi:hypothetical protein
MDKKKKYIPLKELDVYKLTRELSNIGEQQISINFYGQPD